MKVDGGRMAGFAYVDPSTGAKTTRFAPVKNNMKNDGSKKAESAHVV